MSDGVLTDSREARPVVAHREIWRGRIVGVVADDVDLGSGPPILREYVDHPGAVAIVALAEDGRIALQRQYRHPVRAALWEIPAGLLDHDGEDYLEAAAREFAEEADLGAKRWDVLVDIFCTPGGSNESLRVYLARDLHAVEHGFERVEEEAEMELRWVDLDDAVAAVMDGRVHSPSATVGILACAQARSKGYEGLRPADSPWMR